MRVQEKKWIRVRIYIVALFFLGGLGLVLSRAYQLQVLERGRLASFAKNVYRETLNLPSKRGTIYDRDGHELAVSVEVCSVYAHPRIVKDKAAAAKELSRILGLDRKEVLRDLKSNRPFVWIQRKVPPEKVEKTRALGLEGIGYATESRRFYPGKEIAAHLIGFVGQDNEGLEGLERSFDEILKGPQYKLIQMRDALGRPFSISAPTSTEDTFRDLVLTIDKDIQYKAQQALLEAVRKTKAKCGHCIVLNPDTGEILAMAVVPLYNPNIFTKYIPGQWRNRAVTDLYEPGSTIKAFLVAAALDRSVVSPQTRFDCEDGAYRIAGHTIHDTKKHGSMTVEEIVTRSSNIGALKIGQKLGYEDFYHYLTRFGFAKETGIELTGERKGFIRPPRDAREIDRLNLYFGQGMAATSLQLAMAMGVIANGGKLMRPIVVKEVRDQQGRSVKEFHPQMVRRVLDEDTAAKVRKILTGVTESEGTAPLAAIEGFRVAGKTGTSQKVDPHTKRYSRSDYVAGFVGFVPAEDPEILVLVMVDEPEGIPYGGHVAGPVFREVGGWTLNHLRINPRVQEVIKVERKPPARPANPTKIAGTPGKLPDLRGETMRAVLRAGQKLGLQVDVRGTGLAFEQSPKPGTPLEGVDHVKVAFRPPT